ncbi:MAG: hypothetical protein HYV07_21535 [Deltaproteobacteria bacterium]|nr:hypothetical protein [Deltaproteobacteria bacterium]
MKAEPRLEPLATNRASALATVAEHRAACARLEAQLALARDERDQAGARLSVIDHQIDSIPSSEADLAARELGLSDGSPGERVASIRFEHGQTVARRVDGKKLDLGPAPIRFVDVDVSSEVSAAREGRTQALRAIGDLQRKVEEGLVARSEIQRQARETGEALGLDVAVAPASVPRSVLELSKNEAQLARATKALEEQTEGLRRAPYSIGDREVARALGVGIEALGPLDRCAGKSRGVRSIVLRTLGGKVLELPSDEPEAHAPSSPRELARATNPYAFLS